MRQSRMKGPSPSPWGLSWSCSFCLSTYGYLSGPPRLYALLAGILISLGLINALGFSLNLFNIVVLPVMFGIGVDTAVHLTHRRREGATVSVMLSKSGKAAALSALTTAVGFASLLSVPSEASIYRLGRPHWRRCDHRDHHARHHCP